MESELSQKISAVFSNLNLLLKNSGMGLGLGIIKTSNYKGTITFETEYGKGTRFTVSLQ
jgi:signal transduction histidine kinase